MDFGTSGPDFAFGNDDLIPTESEPFPLGFDSMCPECTHLLRFYGEDDGELVSHAAKHTNNNFTTPGISRYDYNRTPYSYIN